MHLLTEQQINDNEDNHLAIKFVKELRSNGTRHFFANAEAKHEVLKIGNHYLPVTITDEVMDDLQSYVVSPHSAYCKYAQEEVDEVPSKILRPTLTLLTKAVGRMLRKAKSDKIVYINNWLLSTNLYPDWDGEEISEIANYFTSTYPDHFIAFRSLNEQHHKHLITKLKDVNWNFLPSRQVWLTEIDNYKDKYPRDIKNDFKVMKKSTLIKVSTDEFLPEDYTVISKLYRQLYLEKYSSLNPDFTPELIELLHRGGHLKLGGLRTQEGKLIGAVGTISNGGIMTTPLVGYDLSLPQSFALYRLTCLMAFEDMFERGVLYNLSSGAATFKKTRGAKPAIEYTAIYREHLKWNRKLPIKFLGSILNNIGVPLIKKWEL